MGVYQAQVEREDDGRWSSWIDDLPGCAAWGYTREEALAALSDAAMAYVADMVEAGDILLENSEVVIQEPTATQ